MVSPVEVEELSRLRARVELLEARLALSRTTDTLIEASLDGQTEPRALLEALLPRLQAAAGATRVVAAVLDEPEVRTEPDEEAGTSSRPGPSLARSLQVGARSLGWVRMDLPPDADEARAGALLDAWSAVLDDHLAMLALARDRHRVGRAVARALADPLLDRGLDRALRIFLNAVRFDDLVLVARPGNAEVRAWWIRPDEAGGIEHRDLGQALGDDAARVAGGELEPVLDVLEASRCRYEAVALGTDDPIPGGDLLGIDAAGELEALASDVESAAGLGVEAAKEAPRPEHRSAPGPGFDGSRAPAELDVGAAADSDDDEAGARPRPRSTRGDRPGALAPPGGGSNANPKLDGSRALGWVVVTRRGGRLGPADRQLLEVFADQLRQRLRDFRRERTALTHSFPPAIVDRLLSEDDYRERWLSPREAPVAILYADIAGFTWLSEAVLRSPTAIGRLVDVWSEAVVRAVWATGGVFDKMVGDCVIALWGPPFFEMAPADACQRAAEAASRIRALTAGLADDPRLPELRAAGAELGVATGLHFAPLYVGLFGPNADYTGFSSGMNQTARLQGLARRGEILCMEAFVEAHGHPDRFGPREEATVKNVLEPIAFRRLA